MKKTLLACLLAVASTSANAEWNAGLSYINLSDSDDGMDMSLGGIVGHASYDYVISDKFTLVPEFRLGVGVSDDEMVVFATPVEVELDLFSAFSVRAQYEVTEQFYVFANPSYGYAKFKITIPAFSESDSDGDWEFGYGAGAGYQVSDSAALEVRYESFDGTGALSAGVSFSF